MFFCNFFDFQCVRYVSIYKYIPEAARRPVLCTWLHIRKRPTSQASLCTICTQYFYKSDKSYKQYPGLFFFWAVCPRRLALYLRDKLEPGTTIHNYIPNIFSIFLFLPYLYHILNQFLLLLIYNNCTVCPRHMAPYKKQSRQA